MNDNSKRNLPDLKRFCLPCLLSISIAFMVWGDYERENVLNALASPELFRQAQSMITPIDRPYPRVVCLNSANTTEEGVHTVFAEDCLAQELMSGGARQITNSEDVLNEEESGNSIIQKAILMLNHTSKQLKTFDLV
jgi:hypothetical protein